MYVYVVKPNGHFLGLRRICLYTLVEVTDYVSVTVCESTICVQEKILYKLLNSA